MSNCVLSRAVPKMWGIDTKRVLFNPGDYWTNWTYTATEDCICLMSNYGNHLKIDGVQLLASNGGAFQTFQMLPLKKGQKLQPVEGAVTLKVYGIKW